MVREAKTAKRAQSKPSRVAPLAVLVAPTTMHVVAMLDPALRVQTLRKGLRQHGAHAFVFLFDGFFDGPRGRTDALLAVIGTGWGFWQTQAHPYTYTPVQGCVFHDVIDVPEAASLYHGVFV